MAAFRTVDIAFLVVLSIATTVYFLRGKLWGVERQKVAKPLESRNKPGGSDTRDIVEKMRTADRNCAIFFGSQTGFSEDLASRLAKEGHSRFGLKTIVCNLEDYDYENLDEFPADKVAMFVLATYGEGEPTDNATDFYNFITADDVEFKNGGGTAGDNPLSNLKYVSFGLGNSTYEHYNQMSKRIDGTLQKLGAQRISEAGEGDDGEGKLEEDFLAWKEPMWAALAEEFGLQEHEPVYEPVFEVSEREDLSLLSDVVFLGEPNQIRLQGITRAPYNVNNPYIATVVSSKQLSKEERRHCVHLDIDLAASKLSYQPGDHVMVTPMNSGAEVDRFLGVFGLIEKRNTGIDVRGIEKSAKVPFPTPTTYDAIARYRMEISGPVSRQFLTSLAEFAPSTEAKAEINKLGKSKDYFHQKVAERRLNLAQTLEIIGGSTPWSAVPFSILIEGLLSLQPRPYSISSSPRVQKDKLTITATVESVPIQDTALTFNGVTSNYLFALQQKQNKDADSNPYGLTYSIEGPRNRYEGIQIPVFIRPSNFRLPSNPATTVIMVGPGSGVAPFRGFIQERAAQKKAGEKVGKTILFYGCRTPGDFIYQEDWKEHQATLGPDFKLVVAFSREGPKKVYVQNKLEDQGKEINDLLLHQANFYVCGGSVIARDVQATLVKLISEQRRLSPIEAEETVNAMRSSKQYQEDAW